MPLFFLLTAAHPAEQAYFASVTPARLPLFPLPLVLFPGAKLPLHIFEPRYRCMLADCLSGSRQFGIVCRQDGRPDHALSPGTVGCVAQIETCETLPDGRANITVTGGDRFALERIVMTGEPYLVGDLAPYTDLAEPGALLGDLARDSYTLFARVATAARAIADDSSTPIDLPSDPAQLAFTIASLVELDLDAMQALLRSRSPAARLRDILSLLEPAAPALEHRAAVHARARTNGHGSHTA